MIGSSLWAGARRSPRLRCWNQAGLAVALALVGIGCRGRSERPAGSAHTKNPAPRAANATFVGPQAGPGRPAAEDARWRGSHHDLALREATDESVLGNFDNASFTHDGVTSTFFQTDGKFFVRHYRPDGQLQVHVMS